MSWPIIAFSRRDPRPSGRFAAGRPTPVSRFSSLGPVVELSDVERRHPRLAAPREDFGLRREPLVHAIKSAFLPIDDARTVLQVVGDHPGTAVGAEDPVLSLAVTGFGVRTVGETLGASAQNGEIRVRAPPPMLSSLRLTLACNSGSGSFRRRSAPYRTRTSLGRRHNDPCTSCSSQSSFTT